MISAKTKSVVDLLMEGGARDLMFVGGVVRDRLLGLPGSKDIDIEVYGLGYDEIIRILKSKFRVGIVGQSFGTVKVDNEIDINIPRRESKCGLGHKGFSVDADPSMTPLEATARRDFTINSIGMRPDGSFYDPFGGIEDLKKGVLRANGEAFCEDPLRVLRGMQFAARFGFSMDAQTVALCRKVLPEYPTLSRERVWGEWLKWAILGKYPSRGLLLLQETGWIDCFPEIAALIGIEQNVRWHPEGDVFRHTCLACDAAAQLADSFCENETERTILLMSVLCHDFGKANSTFYDEELGTWRSLGHAKNGVPLAEAFLSRMGAPNVILEHVAPLVGEHMALISLPDVREEEPSEKMVRRLANRLAPSNIRMWAAVCRSDANGCGVVTAPPEFRIEKASPIQDVVRYSVEAWINVARRVAVEMERPKPILQGRDLIPRGIVPGVEMGRILAEAFEAQLDGEFTDLPGALSWLEQRGQ